jgi:hippurate hydrolase
MSIPRELLDWQAEHTAWRHDLHEHPEIAFEEHYTSDFVARRLADMGLAVDRGLAGTGVVGTLRAGSSEESIGLRADMDALPIIEQTGLPYASQTPGRMHACGHDGHTTMLLAAARYLASTRRFNGQVHFIFQPAEENEGGGRVMVEQGLFERFPCREIYGMHNWPGMNVGQFAVRPGPIMASFDIFEITVHGRGSHAAKPHLAVDPILIAAQIVQALQSIVSRNVDPMDQAVVSVTQVSAGDTWNVIPESAVIRGTTRSFRAPVQDVLERRTREIAEGVAAALGGTAGVRYERRYPPTVNDEECTARAAAAARGVVGADHVDVNPQPSMGAEDFSFMLRHRPGCYIWAGNGPTSGGRLLHNSHYDFNDELIPVGAAYWVQLVETLLPRASSAP